MIDFSPVLSNAYCVWSLKVPIDWIMPISGGQRTGIFCIVVSMADRVEGPLPQHYELYLWELVFEVITTMEDGESMMLRAAEAGWGTIGYKRQKVVDMILKSLRHNSNDRAMLLSASSDPISTEKMRAIKKK